MTFEEAIADIERRFAVVEGLECRWAQTGEEYVVITAAGAWDGDPSVDAPAGWVGRCGFQQMAVDGWHRSVLKYAEGRGTTLYWRIRPEIDQSDFYRETFDGPDVYLGLRSAPFWAIYSRLLVSDKPVLYPTLEALDARAS